MSGIGGVVLAIGFCAVGCVAAPGETTGSDSEELTGGGTSAPGEFPSTLQIGGCTAAKVGPRHILTAAHCVSNDKGQVDRSPTRMQPVTNAVNPDGTHQQLPVRDVWVHPSWNANAWAHREPVPADVAVIEVASGMDNIPIVPVDLRAFGPGTTVIHQGYGCEAGVGNASPGRPRLKGDRTTIVPANALLNRDVGRYGDEASPGALGTQYFFTKGNALDPNEASLCPGDSGGPVYLSEGGKAVAVIGINAYYSFLTNNRRPGVAAYNWLTRLDKRSRQNVGQWLTGLGVTVAKTTTDIHWAALPGHAYSLDVRTKGGEWIGPCIAAAILGSQTSVTFEGVCPSANNRVVPRSEVSAFRLYYSNNNVWNQFVETNYGGTDHVQLSPPGSAMTSVEIAWAKARGDSEYSLDVVLEGGEVIAPCVNAGVLRRSLSYEFDGNCTDKRRRVPLSAVKTLRVCSAEGGNWAKASCRDAAYDGKSGFSHVN